MSMSSKRSLIIKACDERDVQGLANLAASSDGLINDEIRQIAWPILLGYNDFDTHIPDQSWRILPVHRDEEQVERDVARAFVYYPRDESEKQLDVRRGQLQDLIAEVLRRHPQLNYFQGYHDIVQVLLLVLGHDNASPVVARLSLLRIRDFMLPSITAAITHLKLLPTILHATDAKLEQHLAQTQPFFALGATLTLYAHDIQEYGDIARLYDFLLAREAVMSIYLFAAIILSRRDELLEIEADEPDMLHSILSKLPAPLDLEQLIRSSIDLFDRIPPESLPSRAWSGISSISVLKTTRNSSDLARQTLAQGEAFFTKQSAQLRRQIWVYKVQTIIWRYRKPSRLVGTAIIVVALSWWWQTGGTFAIPYLWQRLNGCLKIP